MSKRLFWDMERKEKLRAMWKRGASSAELQEAFGVQMHTISARALTMGLGPRKLERPHDVVRKLLKQLGKATRRDIRKLTGMADTTVDSAIRRLEELGEAAPVGTCRVSAGVGHKGTVEATVFALIDHPSAANLTRSDGNQRVIIAKHRPGTADIPPRHEITAALFGVAQ